LFIYTKPSLLRCRTTASKVGWLRVFVGCLSEGIACNPTTGRAAGVDLRYCGIRALPASTLATLDQLHVLELRGHAIASLPQTVGSLTQLRRIMLEMNHLSELPVNECCWRQQTRGMIGGARILLSHHIGLLPPHAAPHECTPNHTYILLVAILTSC
jgi:hypothetical protein